MPIEFSVAALPARALDDPQLPTTGTGSSTTAAARSTCCSSSRDERQLPRRPAAARATGSPTSGVSTTSPRPAEPTSSCRRRSSTARCASTRRSRTRSPAPAVPAGFPLAEANLAFRNLTRARMVRLATGPADGDVPEEQGHDAAEQAHERADPRRERRREPQRPDAGAADALLQNTPLWFYILREAELNGGKLKGVGARIVAETFHRAMEGSESRSCATRRSSPRSGRTTRRSGWSTCLLSPSRGRRRCSRRSADGARPRPAHRWAGRGDSVRRGCEHMFVWIEAEILHADLDAFFASVEQRDQPRLRGRPMAVGGGVVLAAQLRGARLRRATGRWALTRRAACARS